MLNIISIQYPSFFLPSQLAFHLFFPKMVITFVKRNVREMNRRLLQFLQAENLTQTQFADTLSVARGSVSHILSGRNKPGYDFLESLLLHYPSLNLEWLLTGKGRMYRDISADDGSDNAQLALFPLPNPTEPRQIERILVFYDDNTYQEFHANQ